MTEVWHVYVAKAGDHQVKVGISANPANRLRGLSVPHDPNENSWFGYRKKRALIGTWEMPTENIARKAELLAQKRLKPHHHYGEWFVVDAEVACGAVDAAVTDVLDKLGISSQQFRRRVAALQKRERT